MAEQTGCDVLLCDEDPGEDDLRRAQAAAGASTGILGATFAHIQCYKGDGVRLPERQVELWRALSATGKLRAVLLFESPYALSDLPADVPVVIGYGGDDFTLAAATEAVLGRRACPGKLPVTVERG